jgi:hypothetical protein
MVSHVKGRTQIRDVENNVLGRIFGPKNDEVPAGCMTRSFMIFTLLQI